MTTVQSALSQGYSILFYAEVDTPMLDCSLLLAEVLGITREKLFASLTDNIDIDAEGRFRELIDRRCRGIPVSYIRKKKEFFGLSFYVDERVLVPRPDSELLVETVLSLVEQHPSLTSIHDLCSGSGCIAISLKHAKPGLTVSASDISKEAEEVFRINCSGILDAHIPFYHSDLLNSIDGEFGIIVSNPPYLTDNETDDMMKTGWPEPDGALRGGPEGISVSRLIIIDAQEKLSPGGFLVLESSPRTMHQLEGIFRQNGFTDISVHKDLAGLDRVILGRKPLHCAESGADDTMFQGKGC